MQRNFVICDFEMKSSLPVARRLWIDPPYKPGSAVILHKQSYDTWRLDYALGDDENLEEALKPENVGKMVQAQIDFLDDVSASKECKIVCISPYRPRSRSLDRYQHGRVFFVGDAAHQTPIFGCRGMNQGLLDSSNLLETRVCAQRACPRRALGWIRRRTTTSHHPQLARHRTSDFVHDCTHQRSCADAQGCIRLAAK